ncbi:MAG TPA: FAD-dependent tricarballylate dehydrogenase TcuA [Methylomirabilota bacterium]|jgi:tricarballylate dehydrogenase|nr:FAD-dependent tricarballylate dehydrogenase TcuA [Methylomirabilota bacterium]
MAPNATGSDGFDVVVVGGGNAALCAALAAREAGVRVLLLEKAPPHERGGNSFFTAGGFRFTHGGLRDLRGDVLVDLTEGEAATVDVPPYTSGQFRDDLMRLTEGLSDPDLADVLIDRSRSTVVWMRGHGVRWILMMGRQSYQVGGKHRFWGGLTVEAVGGGPGLIQALYEGAGRLGVQVRYGTRAAGLLLDGRGAIRGVTCRGPDGFFDLAARSVILASGGFEANPEWRARYLGPGWDLARVRGTRHNTGDGIRIALEAGAQAHGNWSGCHAVAWDAGAPPFGDRRVGDMFQKHSYPLGIIVNVRGERFVDEGADFRNYTYAKYGREILRQPQRLAFQIFDQKVVPILREEYRIREVTKAEAGTIVELARQLEIDPQGLVRTVDAFNAAVDAGSFNPAVLDGKGTRGLTPPKSNWALALDTPPFVGYAVTCGITFTFGGLRVTPHAEVLDTDARPIPGLLAAGELVGGLFYVNYPGGTGLMAGAAFGRLAGEHAAAYVARTR